MRQTLTALSAASLLLLSACGGGGSSPAQTATGYFIDSAVSGLTYTSGAQSGVTGTDGSFTYEVGQPITFKLGNIVLGTVTVDKNKRIFPVDLVSGASDETHPKVSLMARLLQALDSDGNPSNGITIDDTTRAAMTKVIDLASTDPADALSQIQTFLQSKSITLVDENTAQAHVRANLIKEFAGTWTGSFAGGDNGPCEVTLSDTGNISGFCTSNYNNTPFAFAVSGIVNSSGGATIGSATTGATFNGTFKRYGEVSGTWNNSNVQINGTFSMKRQAS